MCSIATEERADMGLDEAAIDEAQERLTTLLERLGALSWRVTKEGHEVECGDHCLGSLWGIECLELPVLYEVYLPDGAEGLPVINGHTVSERDVELLRALEQMELEWPEPPRDILNEARRRQHGGMCGCLSRFADLCTWCREPDRFSRFPMAEIPAEDCCPCVCHAGEEGSVC